ncbi:TMEM175 family protein [Geothrix sp. 21YS21S-4]|uniref:TMEM175 family protein n=1 Tax=Geothrix sp. 21YS21S-4 TaxID=3068889 RepID=UPI0027B916B3|nr:TMEM175 family protein [Geothrix sp. 21YS21S-4]
MGKQRLEAFSDGVLAIILTIMVLELKVPHGASFQALASLLPTFVSYVLSFIYVAIYWNNHHHMLHAAGKVNGPILWANTHLLFWLSLIPFATAWMGDNHFAARPVALYGLVLLMAALAYYLLSRCLIHHHGAGSLLEAAVGADAKGKFSIAVYAAAILLSFANRWVGFGLYWLVALVWLVPDRRIERVLALRS